jgi:hypothetical protein
VAPDVAGRIPTTLSAYCFMGKPGHRQWHQEEGKAGHVPPVVRQCQHHGEQADNNVVGSSQRKRLLQTEKGSILLSVEIAIVTRPELTM